MFFKKLTATILMSALTFTLISMANCNAKVEYSLGNIIVDPGEINCFPYRIIKKDQNKFNFLIRVLQGDNSCIDILQDEEMSSSDYPFCVINNGEKRAKVEGKFISDEPIELKKTIGFWDNYLNDKSVLVAANIFPILICLFHFNRAFFGYHQSHKLFT